jgi:uncharacterized membrane protein
LLSEVPKELLVFLISAMPIGELRAGIPFGLFQAGLDPRLVFLLAILGNFAPVIPILLLLEPVSGWLMKRSKYCDRLFCRLFEKTRHKHSARLEKYGTIGLVLFVAIPSPGTGAWSGSLAAWLFGIEPRHAVPAIGLGILLSGVLIMTGSTLLLALVKLVTDPVVLVSLMGLAVAGIAVLARYIRSRQSS